MNTLTSSEKYIKERYKGKGWEVVKPSWPDLLMWHPQTKEIQFVEVKGHGDRLSYKQRDSFAWLQEIGFLVTVAFITSPTGDITENIFNRDLNVKSIRRRKRSPTARIKKPHQSMGEFVHQLNKNQPVTEISKVAPYLSEKDPFRIDETDRKRFQ